jgi:hypothetical protein
MKCAEPTMFHRKSGMWGTRGLRLGQAFEPARGLGPSFQDPRLLIGQILEGSDDLA